MDFGSILGALLEHLWKKSMFLGECIDRQMVGSVGAILRTADSSKKDLIYRKLSFKHAERPYLLNSQQGLMSTVRNPNIPLIFFCTFKTNSPAPFTAAKVVCNSICHKKCTPYLIKRRKIVFIYHSHWCMLQRKRLK